MTVIIQPAAAGDAAEILALQKLAYRSEAAIYDDWSIPPLRQTLDEMRADLARQTCLKATIEGRIVGSVRAHAEEGTCYVGRLIVHPDHQVQGIGTRLMSEIEGAFPGTARFELFTGHRSERNLRLYRKLGYEPCREERVSDALTLVYLQKVQQPLQAEQNGGAGA